MTIRLRGTPGFWSTVGLLLRSARRRAAGRQKRQSELFQYRARKRGTDWRGLGFGMAILFMAIVNGAAAFVLSMAVESGQRFEAELQGKIVVSSWFLRAVDTNILAYSSEAESIANRYGGEASTIEQKLRDSVEKHGTRDLITRDQAAPGISAVSRTGRLPALMGSLVLLWWAVMVVFQGEGLELDLQRQRHPMWEWLFAHPVPPGAVFLAEMLSPIAANPIYWSAPLFVGLLYGMVHGAAIGILAALLMGIPITIAAACLGKAFEIGVTLRFSPRSRGAVIGIMSWMGYASLMMFFMGMLAAPKIFSTICRFFVPLTVLPWPWLRLFLGGRPDGSFSFASGLLACWVAAGLTSAAAVRFAIWGAQQGLSGNVTAADSRPSAPKNGKARFGKDPLYRKEFLWFIRDRSAIVQTILIPLTVASFQVFNLRGVLAHAQGAWNYLCGAGILFGTYFLWILGPKSLSSEGNALWIALTWPRGLESLLKAKAWLWSMISSGIVGIVLCYAAFLYPANTWKIFLVGVGWFFFGRSMAEKTVTLVSVTSSSGEQEPIHWTRRMAAQLGMLTFSIGVLTQQWHIAIMGIVYSYLTAAAMWQNFRARLPYLYDPWSEKLPPPPTLMHAMIAISILVEGGAVVTGMGVIGSPPDKIPIVQAVSYGFCALFVALGTAVFLRNRDVLNRDVWRWRDAAQDESKAWWRDDGTQQGKLPQLLLVGAVGGVLLGVFAIGYMALLKQIPDIAEILRKSQEQLAKMPDLRKTYGFVAVAFAPFAEEYLFRGLLFRALDREWGGWRAVIGSAAFFAIYHPALAWLPVGLLGAANALLFKKTGRLVPAVILHTVYNIVVLS